VQGIEESREALAKRDLMPIYAELQSAQEQTRVYIGHASAAVVEDLSAVSAGPQ
jgi:hypothetical protein